MKVKVAVLQYDCPMDSGESFTKLDEMLLKAVKLGAKLVVAPETAVGDVAGVKKTGEDYFPRISALVKNIKSILFQVVTERKMKNFTIKGLYLILKAR